MTPETIPGPQPSFKENRFIIPSDAKFLASARQEFLSRLNTVEWLNSEDLGILEVAFDELLTNGMKHGNEYNINEPVVINLDLTTDMISVEFIDQGIGFVDSLREVLDSEEETNRTVLSHGRAFLFIKNAGIELSVQNLKGGGCKVTMTKRKPSPVSAS